MRAPGLWGRLVVALCALAAWAGAAAAQPAPRTEGCVACHLEIGEDRLVAPAKAFEHDIHKAKGFGCTSCHGGDAKAEGLEAMDPAKGYIGKPSHQQVIQVCGRCHADARFMKQYNPSLRVDQVAEYQTSVHGRRLKEFNDPKVATCSSCHPAHAIRPKSDPASSVHPLRVADTCGGCHGDAKYMASYKIPTDQLEKYKQSIHWQTLSVKGDLAAPTCNNCHGNHGAAPPGLSWVGNVCGQCHAVVADVFAKSAHAKTFAQMGAPGCATCHSNHAIKPASEEMVGLGDKSVCGTCHAADDKGGRAAAEIRQALDTLRQDEGQARAILTRAEHAGMEVSQPLFELNGATDALIKARNAVHSANPGVVKKEIDVGLGISAKARQRGERALEELQFRRKGLGVSLAIILLLVVGLVLKIRQLERPQRS